MTVKSFVEYRGERFYLQSNKRYFQSGKKDCAERLLHRRVWSDANGPIPPGMTIHHIDGDWRNNELENLEALPMEEHFRTHMLERWADEASRRAFTDGLAKAREAAKAWHASPEGIAWHSKNGKAAWNNRVQENVSCVVCGEAFLAFRTEVAKTCSKSCRAKLTYPNRFTAEASCKHCGRQYVTSRYRKTMFCSRTCSNRHRHANSS